jgi:autotransporter-associated beta strand protein
MAAAAAFLAVPAFAQTTDTWIASSGSWSIGNNWSNGVPPTDGTAALVFGNSSTWTSTADLSQFIPVNSLTFNGNGNGTISGNTINFVNNPSTNASASITMNSTGNVQIASAMYATGNLNITVAPGAGTLFLGQSGTANWFTGGAGNITISSYSSNMVLCGDLGGWNPNGPGINYFTVAAGVVQCSDGPNGGGNVFNNFTVLNVLAGATYDFNTNNESMGAIAGAGNITNLGEITTFIPGNFRFDGSISSVTKSSAYITQGVAGTLTLGGSNTYGGPTTASVVGAQIQLANSNAVMNSTLTVTAANGLSFDTNHGAISVFNLGGLSGATNASLTDINGYPVNLSIGANNSSTTYTGLLSGPGSVAKVGNATLTMVVPSTYTGTTSVAGGYLRLLASTIAMGSGVSLSAGTLEMDGNAPNFTPATFSAGANTTLLWTGGTGTMTLTGTNNFGGSSLQLYSGGLAINDASNNSIKLAASPALTLGSGILGLTGNSNAASMETVSGVNLLGVGKINVTTGNNQNASLNLGVISFNGGSALNVNLGNSGSGLASVITKTPNAANLSGATPILGGNAVVNGSDWAATGSGSGSFDIAAVPATAYTLDGAWSPTTLNSVSTNGTLALGSTTAALRFDSRAAASITLTLNGTNSIVTGGLLVTPNVGNNAVSMTGGTISQPSGTPLDINQYNPANTLTIGSTLGNTAYTSTASATFSSGATQLTIPTAGLYPGMLVSSTGTAVSSGTRILSINGPNSVTLTLATAGSASSGALTFNSGTPLVKSGPGTLVLSSVNTLNGGIILDDGTLQFSSVSALGAATNPIVFNGGTLYPSGIGMSSGAFPWLFGRTGGSVNIDAGQTVTRSGADIFGSGSLNLTGPGTLTIGSAASSFSGQVCVNQGTINFTASEFASAQGITVAPGAQYAITDNKTATYKLSSGAVLALNGLGPNNSGAFGLTVLSGGTANPAPVSTFSSPIYLASDSLLMQTTGTAATSGISTLKLSGAISGPGSLLKGGDGILQISSANNAYGGATGTTRVLNGTLQVAALNALPTTTNLVLGDSAANTSGILDLNNQTQTVASLLTAGSGLNNAVISSGTATAGVLTVNYQGATPMVYTGALGSIASANFALAVTGSGTVVLDGYNVYNQGTTIGPGATLQLGNNDNNGSVTGNVTNNGSLIFAGGGLSGGIISGSGSVTITQGMVTLTGPNTYGGATYIQNGTLVASAGTGAGVNPLPSTTNLVFGSATNPTSSGILQLGDNSGPVNQTVAGLSSQGTSGGNAIYGGNNSGNSTLTVNLTTDSTYNGSLGGPSSVSFAANNLALLLNGASRLTLTGVSSYSGSTAVNGGILEAGSAFAFSPNSAYTVTSPGTLRISGNAVSVGSIAGNGTIENANTTAGMLTTGYDNTNTAFSGLIRDGAGGGTLSLTKTGSGVLSLLSSNTYSGLTTINAGTVQLFGHTSQASPYLVSNGATLAVSSADNTATIGPSLTLGNGPSDSMSLDLSIQTAWSQSVPILAVNGPITTNGATKIDLSSALLPTVGLYPLIDYSGSILGRGSAGFTIGSLPSTRIQATLENDPVNDVLYLNVISSDSPRWTGAVNGNWDTTTKNWALLSSGAATTYYQGDNVLFDDTAKGTTSVHLASSVTPNSVTFKNNSLVYTLSGAAITGPGALTVTGSGLAILANDNTYTGGTTVSAGTLQIGNGGTTGSVIGDVTNNGTFALNRSDNTTFSGTINGSGTVAQLGSGQTTLTANNTYTGATIISNGTLQLGAGGNTGMIVGDVVNNGALVFNRSDAPTYSGVIRGGGAVTQAGPGTLIFTGNHTYTGLTTISGGTLQIGNGGSTGNIVSDVAFPSQYAVGAALVFARSDTVTYGGSTSGIGQLVQQGSGNLILTGNNTHTGGTVFSSGTVTVSSDANLGASNGDLIFNNGTLAFSAPVTVSSDRNLFPNGQLATIDLNGNNVTMGAQIQPGIGTGSILMNGPGTLTLTNLNNTNTGNPPNAGSTFTVNNGVLSVSANPQVPALQLVLNGGTLQLSQQMGIAIGPAGTGVPPTTANGTEFATNILVGANGATIDTGSNSIATLGKITGAAGTTLTKIGNGTWCPVYGLGGSGFNGNVHIVSGAIVDSNSYQPGENTDAFGNSTVVTVDAGAIWDDSWGNGENLGGIAGAGDIYEGQRYSLALEANVSTVFSGRILCASVTPTSSLPTTWALAPGAGVGLSQVGGGTITLTNTGSTFGGTTTIDSGTIIVSANVMPNQTGPLGLASSAILVGNTSGNSSATFLVDTAGVQIGRAVQLQSGNTGVSTVGAINTSGTVTYSGNIILGSASAAAMPLTVTAAPGGTLVFSGPLTRASGATGSNDTVTMTGGGTVVLSGPNNNYQGATNLQFGTLVAAGGDNNLPVTTSVTLGDIFNNSAVLQLGSDSGPIQQTIAGLATLGNGAGNAVVGGNGSLPSTLTVNTAAISTFNGTLGGSTTTQNNLNFALAGLGQLTLTGSNTYAGTTTVSGGTLVAGSPSAFGVNSAVTVSPGATALLGGNSITIGSLAGNGIVANANATAAQLTVGSDNTNTQFTGSLQDGIGGGPLRLRKIGSGTLTLGGTHTYSGPTTVAGGVFQLLGDSSLISPVTVNAGAGLSVLNSTSPVTVNLSSSLTFGAATADVTALNFNLLGNWSSTTPLLAASGAVTLNGSTTINISAITLPLPGMYTLLDYGSLDGSGSFSLGSLPSSQMSAHLVNNTGNDSIALDVTVVDASKWTGAVNNTWDVNAINWKLVSSNAATKFSQGDNVQFDDTGANTAINLPSAVTPSSVVFSNNTVAYSLSGPGKISGSTGVVMTGSGMVTLTTNNDYSGGTYVNAGTLQIGSGGTTGSIGGNVTNNALLVFNRSDSPVFSGVISGTGAVTQSGNGLLTLLGNNTYSGLTTVSAGSLQVGNGGASGAIAGNVLNNSAMIFNRADTNVYTGSIAGSGSFVQRGSGVTVLTGSNSYTGGTIINNGTFQIGNGGTAGSIVGDVLNNGVLIFNRSDMPVFAGAISGQGSLVQQGAGTLVLTGNSSYTGGTAINSGTLQLGNGGTSGSIVGNVAMAGTLAINQSGSVTLGALSGNGSLAQVGPGLTTVSGMNTYFGGTTISAGTVSIGNYQNLGTGSVTINGGALQITGNMGVANDPTTSNGTDFASNIQIGPKGGTIDTGSNWFSTTGKVTGAGTVTKLGTGTWYVRYGMGGSSFTGGLNILAGTVLDDYNNLPGGNTDAISDTTVVTVAAGATWDDSWGNGEALGAIAGAGTVIEANGCNMSFYSPTATTFSGQLTVGTNSNVVAGGATSITELGGGSITLSGTGSDYGGVTSVTNGAIIVSANVLPNQPGPLGQANSQILVGDTSGSANASLLIDTPNVQIARDVRIQSGNTGVSTIGGTNTSGTVYFTGNILLGTDGGAAMPLTLTAEAGGTVEIDGPIIDGGSVTGATDSLTKVGPGTLILTNSTNGFHGGLDVEEGTVVIANAGALPDGSALAVGAGANSVFDASVASRGAGNAAVTAAVPEPNSLVLLAAGGLLVAFDIMRRRRRLKL